MSGTLGPPRKPSEAGCVGALVAGGDRPALTEATAETGGAAERVSPGPGAGVNDTKHATTMGSLFDGIGGFPLAAERYGIKPLWASEIERFPIKVTSERFPSMAHQGDITKLSGKELFPVDIICGGSPCQDLSVAGARAGLAGARSGLFMEQVRIVKEMRTAEKERGRTGAMVRPRYMIWENVPGAFSSGTPKGEDFRIVLEELARVSIAGATVPRPYPCNWASAGVIIQGRDFSLAWRCLDAQYWGVAQRRKRIFLVADFAGVSAPLLLFAMLGPANTAEEGGVPNVLV